MSVLISHPSVAPFVQQAARAIHEAGQLEKFVTTVRYDPSSFAQRLACAAARFAGRDGRALFRRREVTEVPLEKVETHPSGELLRLAAGSMDRDGRLTDFIWERAEIRFDRIVAGRLTRGLTGIYGYEHCSRLSFERARDIGLRIAYDMPSLEPRFIKGILDAELEKFPELRTAYHRRTERVEGRRMERRAAEWRSADLVIAASAFTRRSFESAGLDSSKVSVVHYGAPPAIRAAEARGGGSRPVEPLALLWAGTFGIRKGAHYLLEAWRAGGLGRHARLRIYGSVALPERLLSPVPEGVELCGSVPRSELMDAYRRSDALVFPTLCDGFGMVATEAWSQGLPVLMTESAGASDLLRPGQNGLLLRPRDAGSIAESVDWCLAHRDELRAMREAAAATASGWQWSDYRRTLAEVLRAGGLFGKG